jgi:hypothetical protein
MRGLPAALLAAREALAAEREEPVSAAPEGATPSSAPTVEDDDQQMTLF